MASAYPVAIFLMLAMAGLIIFPVFWLSIAYWQRKNRLNKMSKLSVALSITPILSFILLYFGESISPKFTVIVFFATPVINIIFLITILFITLFKVRRYKQFKRDY